MAAIYARPVTTPLPSALPAAYDATRVDLHRVAVHVLARRRVAVNGRFGLRPTAGGFGTPAFGDPDHEEVLRVAGHVLVRERRTAAGMQSAVHPIAGASLAALAAFADADLAGALSVGTDTPAPGAVDEPLTVDAAAAAVLGGWLDLGARAIDRVLADVGAAATPTVAQIWPEHFDLGIDLDAGSIRTNLGASAGDGYSAEPYVYVGPRTADRPGDPEFWNAPFGALLGYGAIAGSVDPISTMTEFLHRGAVLLAS